MGTRKVEFGMLDTGKSASLYLLECGPLRASFTDYGATLVSLFLPPCSKVGDDINLGFSTLAGYTGKHPYFGATVGRFAGRIGSSKFSLDGKQYTLFANDGTSNLHGGLRGFNHCLWRGETFEEGGEPRLRLSRTSPDGEEGFPANLESIITFGLTRAQELVIRFEAASDAPTIVNLTNHAYFNLGGEGRGSIGDHEISIQASRYLETGQGLVPTGRLLDVTGTLNDLRVRRPIEEGQAGLGGYDTYFVVDRPEGATLVECARVYHGATGRQMTLRSTFPGLQFYTGNFLNGEPGKHGSKYQKHGGFCLEAQYFPDSPNNPLFPSVEIRSGQAWRHESRFAFEF